MAVVLAALVARPVAAADKRNAPHVHGRNRLERPQASRRFVAYDQFLAIEKRGARGGRRLLFP